MDVMLDLETFSTAPNAAIIQIGACFFDPHSTDVGEKFSTNVNLASCMLLGLHVSMNTVEWWASRDHSHLLNDAVPLAEALSNFSKWYLANTTGDTCVWSHGAAFDVPVLDFAYRLTKRIPPWHYRYVRDTRTLFAIAQERGWSKPNVEAAHDGLADAVAQAIQVQDAYRFVAPKALVQS